MGAQTNEVFPKYHATGLPSETIHLMRSIEDWRTMQSPMRCNGQSEPCKSGSRKQRDTMKVSYPIPIDPVEFVSSLRISTVKVPVAKCVSDDLHISMAENRDCNGHVVKQYERELKIATSGLMICFGRKTVQTNRSQSIMTIKRELTSQYKREVESSQE